MDKRYSQQVDVYEGRFFNTCCRCYMFLIRYIISNAMLFGTQNSVLIK